MKKRDALDIISPLLVLFGLIFILAGVFTYKGHIEYMKTAEPIMATIEFIDIRGDDEDREYDVFVSYVYQGIYQETELNFYSSSMYVGQELELYVDPNNPSDVRDNSVSGFIIFILFGSLAMIIGFMFGYFSRKKKANIKRLKGYNFVFMAQVVSFSEDRSVNVNGNYGKILHCISNYNGNALTFQSERLFVNRVDYMIGRVIPVYVNPNDWNDYYVDVSNI